MKNLLPLWGLSLLLLPVLIVYSLLDALIIPRLLLMLSTVFITVLWSVWTVETSFNKRLIQEMKSPLGLSLLAYLFANLLAVSWSLNPGEALAEVVKVVCWVSTILCFIALLATKNALSWLTKAMGISLLLVLLIGWMQYFTILDQLDENKILYQVTATLGHKNLLATGLVLGLFISLIGWLQSTQIYWKAIFVGLLLASIPLILLVQSRVAWLSLLGGLGVMALLLLVSPTGRKWLWRPKGALIAGALLLLGVLGSWQFLSSQESTVNNPLSRIQAVLDYQEVNNEHTATIKERFQLWQNSWKIFKEQPLTGVGPGHWKVHFPKYSIDGLRSEQGEVFFQRPHNDFLWVLSELGILGGLCYLAIFGVLGYYVLRLWRNAKLPASDRLLVLAACGGLCAFLLASLVDFPKERPVHLVWTGFFMAILAFVWSKNVKKTKKEGSYWPLYGMLAFVVMSVFITSKRAYHSYHAKRSLEVRSAQKYPIVLTRIAHAENWLYPLDPAATPLAWYRGEALFMQGQYTAALAAFEQAKEVHPYHLHTLNNIAAAHFALKNTSKAQEYFKEVLEFAPHFPDANLNMAAMAFQNKEVNQAMFYLGNARPGNYDDARFVQFLTTIVAAHIDQLQAQPELTPIHGLLKDLKNTAQWQKDIHQKALKNKTSFSEQIRSDILFTALEQKLLNKEDSTIIDNLWKQIIINH